VTKSAIRNPQSAIDVIRNPQSEIVRPGLVHRLDKQTSGLIVIAKSVRAHRWLARQFQRKFVEKKYLAVVDGIVRDDEGAIVAPIGRYGAEKRWDIKEGGKISETRYRVIDRRRDSTLLELEPVTGRTNQLRIHCASIGHPIVGDTGRGGRDFPRLCLHAYMLSIYHQVKRHRLVFEIGAPLEFDVTG
jgi:23S rRNA pseudouridine1911/1915/1917 synthase